MSQRIIDSIVQKLESSLIEPEIKERLNQQFHHLLNMHVLSFQTKGQILEKLKRFEEAIEAYQFGKQVVEANYGTTSKMYIDMVNSINGAKLRTKYFLNSNLGPNPAANYHRPDSN